VRVLGARPGRRNRRIGYVPQRKAFDPGLRIRGIDIVALGLDGARWGTPLPWLTRLVAPQRAADRRRRLGNVIDLVGATDYARGPIGRAPGAKQRAVLTGRGLLPPPDLLLLAEPLESLDVPSQAGISA